MESDQRKLALPSKAVEILRRACKDKKSLAAAARDPRALLKRHGIKLSDDFELRIYQRKGKNVDGAEPILRDLSAHAGTPNVATAFNTWWAEAHGGCPFPTVPYTTKKEIEVCDVWGVYAGPKEWVQDVPGTAFGHWTYPQAASVCLLSHKETVTVTECMYYLTPA